MSREIVKDLVARGALRVEDGNHGNDRPRPDEFVADGVAFIRAADMTSGIVDFDGAGKISDVALHRIRKGIGLPGDVILSHKGTVGRVLLPSFAHRRPRAGGVSTNRLSISATSATSLSRRTFSGSWVFSADRPTWLRT